MNFRGAKVVKVIELLIVFENGEFLYRIKKHGEFWYEKTSLNADTATRKLHYIYKKNPPMKVDSKNTNDEKKIYSLLLQAFEHCNNRYIF